MPFTPFHLGPSLAAGIGIKRLFHIPSFLAGSVILDIEPLTILLFHLNRPLHGFFHTLVGGFLVSIPLALLLLAARKPVARLLSALKFKQSQSFPFIFLGAFSGTTVHVLLDSIFHKEIHPFFPLAINPFYRLLTGMEIHIICLASFVLAGVIYGIRLVVENNRRNKDSSVTGN